jgi:hypothetical protein
MLGKSKSVIGHRMAKYIARRCGMSDETIDKILVECDRGIHLMLEWLKENPPYVFWGEIEFNGMPGGKGIHVCKLISSVAENSPKSQPVYVLPGLRERLSRITIDGRRALGIEGPDPAPLLVESTSFPIVQCENGRDFAISIPDITELGGELNFPRFKDKWVTGVGTADYASFRCAVAGSLLERMGNLCVWSAVSNKVARASFVVICVNVATDTIHMRWTNGRMLRYADGTHSGPCFFEEVQSREKGYEHMVFSHVVGGRLRWIGEDDDYKKQFRGMEFSFLKPFQSMVVIPLRPLFAKSADLPSEESADLPNEVPIDLLEEEPIRGLAEV